jgi:glycosyltransferase involved in cell wall biosynthesis
MCDLRIPQGIAWELLIVNNNCSDHTDAIIARYSDCLPIRRVVELRTGKSHAANTAITLARGELILWTDDDVLVDSEWLAEYVEVSKAWPDAQFFGGTVDPYFEIEPPQWLNNNLKRIRNLYAILELGADVRPLLAGEMPVGANMAIRAKLLRQFRFNTDLGPSRKNQIRGEEIELLERLMAHGHRGVWVGTAKVRHFIPAERLTGRFLWDWYRGSGRTVVRRNQIQECAYICGVPRWVLCMYIKYRLLSVCLYPLKNGRWLDAFRKAAQLRGVMEESRKRISMAGVSRHWEEISHSDVVTSPDCSDR